MMLLFSLEEICRITGGSYTGPKALLAERVSAVSMDSRRLPGGSLFIALEGERFDGHDFIASAAEQGAVAAVVQRRGEYPLPVITVESTLEAYRALAGAYRAGFDIPVIGVTGSVGKTTTKELIAGVLSQQYNTLKNHGNLNNQTGVPITLFRLEPGHEAAVVELGTNHFGEIESIARIARPTIGVITNIGESHMEFFGSREGILREKASMLSHLMPGGRAVIWGDDDMLSTLRGRVDNLITYGFGPENDIRGVDIEERGLEGSAFTLLARGLERRIAVPAPGRHQALNALCAAAVGLCLGMDMDKIARGIEGYMPVSGRMDIVKTNTLTLLNDAYNASPTSMRASIAIAAGEPGRTVLILGDMRELGERGPEYHRELGRYAASSGAELILTVGELAHELYLAARSAGADARHYESREALTAALKGLLRAGDTVLVKASLSMGFSQVAQYIAAEF